VSIDMTRNAIFAKFFLASLVATSASAQDNSRPKAETRVPPYRPYFTSKTVGSASSTARSIVDLRRSQRAKQFIPSEMGKTQEWSRWSTTTSDPWTRSGGWDKAKPWENPSSWKGDGLDKTSTTLTYTRGRNPTAAERHPVRSANSKRR